MVKHVGKPVKTENSQQYITMIPNNSLNSDNLDKQQKLNGGINQNIINLWLAVVQCLLEV